MYSCHRSGHFKSAGKRKRYRKLSKTNKIGSFCPAYIRAEICKRSDKVSIKYCPTHLGHDFKVKYLRLSKQEKEQIAGELHSGVPPSFILNKISETASPTKRLAATTSQDIRNISKCYGINMNVVRSEDDVTSVDCWVKEMQSGNHNPILLYKLPGDINSELPDMEEDDFVLGFMNLAQEEILKIYGKDVILIDSTHGTNKYNIQLTTLVIKDDNWEGFPVAFLWSNRQHKNVFRYFFQSIRERVGDIKTNAFMSDDYVAFYNAWYSVFSKPNFYVLCDWHVKRSWKKNLTSGATQIKNKDKLQDTLDMLYEMINEVDINTFEKLYKCLQAKLLTDPETFFFGCYFIAEYGNRTKQWAACYRVGSRINTNMTVERWHKDLKYNSDLKGKCGGRLDKAIHSLMKSLRLKLSNRLSSLQRGKLTKKLVLIRKTHKMAESIKEEIEIYEQADKLSYIVTSASHEGETYKVRILDLPEDHKCNLKCETCNVCIHKMTCECPNASIKFNMCKHIHVVCMKKYNFADCENTGLNICEPVCAIEESLMPSRIPQIELEPEYVTREKEAIANSKLCSNPYNKLKEAAISAVMGLVTEIETFQNEEQYKELIKCVSVAKHKCRALNSLKTLPPVSTTTSSLKKIEPQRRFPSKKKKTKKEPLRPNYNSKDTIQRILTSNPETYAVAKEAVLIDHNYDIQES